MAESSLGVPHNRWQGRMDLLCEYIRMHGRCQMITSDARKKRIAVMVCFPLPASDGNRTTAERPGNDPERVRSFAGVQVFHRKGDLRKFEMSL